MDDTCKQCGGLLMIHEELHSAVITIDDTGNVTEQPPHLTRSTQCTNCSARTEDDTHVTPLMALILWGQI